MVGRNPAAGSVRLLWAWVQQPWFLQLRVEASSGSEVACAVEGSVVAPSAVAAAGADIGVPALLVEHRVA